jgi:hypothetical protein
MPDRAIHSLRRWSTAVFVVAAAWAVLAFVVPFELLLSMFVLFALGAAAFGLRWYAEVLEDRAAADDAQNEMTDHEGDPQQ